jgi:hypothetical protein
MKLTDQQLAQFDELGYYLHAGSAFPPMKCRPCVMRPQMFSASSARRSGAKRAGCRAPHLPAIAYNEACRILASDPRLVDPLSSYSARPVYIHQFKINAKAAFTGEVWQWHQDFPTWHQGRWHARRARDEHRRVPRRSVPVQRPADVYSAQPQSRVRCHPGTTNRRPRTRYGHWTRTR